MQNWDAEAFHGIVTLWFTVTTSVLEFLSNTSKVKFPEETPVEVKSIISGSWTMLVDKVWTS